MYTIQEDDYAQTAFPRWDSDGAIKLYWDHPGFPEQWSGKYCDSYPYDNWSEVEPLHKSHGSYGAWSLDNIILGHFGLYNKGVRIPWKDMLSMSPEDLKRVDSEIYRSTNFEDKCGLIILDFEEISREMLEYFINNPAALHDLHWRKFEFLLEAIFRNQGYITAIGSGSGDGGVDLRIVQKDSVGEIVTLVQAKQKNSKYPVKLEAVSALYGIVEAQQANRGLFVTTSSYLPSTRKFADARSNKLVLADTKDIVRWCKSSIG